MGTILPREFYAQEATAVARGLIGAVLVRVLDGERVSGRIVETEAYRLQADAASHSHRGHTPRNDPMWGEPGRAYVYFTYGMHWLLNAVCEGAGHPAAVLLRALEPLEGLDVIAARRDGRPPTGWASGPARLTQALGIGGAQNRADLTTPEAGLWIEAGDPVPEALVRTGPRIGLGKHVAEPWRSIPWRWWVAGSPYVSR